MLAWRVRVMRERRPIKKDEWAVVLDFLSHGHSAMERSQPVAHVVGEEYFSLLEVIIRDEIALKAGDKIYIGDDKRDKVRYIRGRITLTELTVSARGELEDTIEEIIKNKPEKFLDFFNKSGNITTRLHQLELLPGIGKRHLWAIIDERKVKPFQSFEDIKKRVPLLPDPEKMVIKRVIEEMEDKDKYRVFVPRMEKGR
jgi:putative nucleotide binding protein